MSAGPRPSRSGEGSGPLAGLTFLNTREASAAGALTERLEALGATVIEAPTIAFAPPEDWAPFDARVAQITGDDWVVFTSATAVTYTLERLWALNQPPSVLRRGRLAAIGPGTARALEEHRLEVDVVPARAQQEAFLRALLERLRPGDKVWIPRAQDAREALVRGLREAGYPVAVTPVYRTVVPGGGLGAGAEALRRGHVDWILFTSSSTVRHFFELLGDDLRAALTGRWPRVGCLGAITAETARGHGLPVTVVPERQDLDGLVGAVAQAAQGGAG